MNEQASLLSDEFVDDAPIVQRPNSVIRNGGPQLLRGLMIPLSPSANTYWRTRIVKPKNGKPFASTYIGEEGVAYQKTIAELALVRRFRFQTDKRLSIDLVVCMRDRRRCDIDNRIKPCLDALKEAGVFVDDEQIDEIRIRRGPIIKEGKIIVSLVEVQPNYDLVLKEAWG